MKKYQIKYSYYDQYCRNGKWSTQTFETYAENEYEAQRKCIEFNGLGVDCDYKIDSVKEL